MDATAQDVEYNQNATFTLSEAQLQGSCIGIDPEDPTCAKISISGSLDPVAEQDIEYAQLMLFSRHPAMKQWPQGHQFRAYELNITTMRLLDFYGGPHDISPQEYFDSSLGLFEHAVGRGKV